MSQSSVYNTSKDVTFDNVHTRRCSVS